MSAAAAHRLPHRRRLVRHRRRQGAARARRRRSTASRRPTASAATGSSATRTGCRPPTATCTSTRRATGWSTRTSRCRPTTPTSRTTRRSPRTSTTTSTTSASATGSSSRRASSTSRASADGRLTSCARRRRDARATTCVLVANGHHWDPRWPEPAFPGADTFDGRAAARPRTTSTPTIFAARTSSCSAWATARWTSRSSPRYVAEDTLPRRPPRRVDHPEVHLRPAARPAQARPADPVQDPPAS